MYLEGMLSNEKSMTLLFGAITLYKKIIQYDIKDED
jgi:hypothetical protein